MSLNKQPNSLKTNSSIKSAARANILNKLKKEVTGADYTKLPKEEGYQYQTLTIEEQLVQFIGHLEANHAQVIKLATTDIAKVVSEQLSPRHITTLLCGKETPFSDQLSLLENKISLQFYDFDLNEHQSKTATTSINTNKEYLFNDVPASITSSHGGIAATGSIVLWPTVNEPRALSLVPPVHFVVVDAQQIFQNFEGMMKAQQWHNQLPTNAILISGPSKTADIQQTLAYGAHGPKELIVLLVNVS